MPRPPRRTTSTVAAGLAVGLALVTAPSATAAVDGRELLLTAERSSLRGNDSGVALDSRTVTRNGGQVRRVARGSGHAFDLPDYRSSSAPVAVMTFVDRTGVDDLTPGSRDFSFGADVNLDAHSQGTSSDNGNNLVQRGLYGARMQYKIEVDSRRPACRVKGDRGAVTVRSGRAISTGSWYRIACRRDGSTVVLKVTPLGGGSAWSTRGSGGIGSLVPPSRSTPLSVGGKVESPTRLAGSSDQFNGRVDNVFVNIR